MGRHPKAKVNEHKYQVSSIFKNNMSEKLDFLDELSNVRGEFSRSCMAMRDTLLAAPDKQITLDLPTFIKIFGKSQTIKHKFTAIKQNLRMKFPDFPLHKLRIAEYENKIMIWMNP